MTDYIEGKRPVVEALRSGMPIRNVLMSSGLEQDSIVKDILRKAKQRDIVVKEVPKKKLDAISERGSHQGIMAEVKDYKYADMAQLLQATQKYAEENEGRCLVVVCDHLTDAGNLGAIARSAESVGACGVIIPNKRSAHVTAATYKSSAGAVAHIPIVQVPNIARAIEQLQEAGFWAAAASEHATDLVWKTNLKGKIVLIIGNEQEGVSRLVLEKCDFICALPQVGEISSLNAAQASTVFMYEWLRQNVC